MHSFASFIVALFIVVYPQGAVCEEPISPFLTHMPQNSDKRCVGIAGVAEALLEGKRVTELKSSVNDLAREIYQDFTSDKLIRYPSHIDVGNQSVPIDDPEALEALSTRVAELYKADFYRMSGTSSGINRLSRAQQNVVRTRDELVELLQADRDKIILFCCFGKRIFPSGKVSETSHAVLIQPMPHDEIIVYDPNDPGRPAACTLREVSEGLQVSWTCNYRNKVIETTQHYLIVPQTRYFATLK